MAEENAYELVVFVSSKNLNYTNAELFFDSLLAQEKTPTVGHAWIRLVERDNDKVIRTIDGGHSGEFGIIAPQYFARLVLNAQNPNVENPVQVLYQPLFDGQFERGDGGNVPTYGAAFSLTKEGYLSLCSLFEKGEGEYPFYKWSLTEYNCVQFVITCLARIGIVLDVKNVVQIPAVTRINGVPIRMWSDERFSTIEVSTPEKLEAELRQLVALGVAQECIYTK